MKDPQAPRHERRQAVDQKIYRATLELLATRGSMNLRIIDVAKHAGVDKTSVYRRHKSIESIVEAAISGYAAQEIPLPNTGALLEDFKALARSVAALLESAQGKALMQATASAKLAELRQRYWEKRLGLAATLIEHAQQRKECSKVHQPQAWIESLVAPIHFRIFQSQGQASFDFLDAQALRVFQAIIAQHPPN